MIEVIDDFLSEKERKFIHDRIMHGEFPWTWGGIHHVYNEVKNPLKNYQLCHTFYTNNRPDSDQIELMNPIIARLDPCLIFRIKANLLPVTDKIEEHPLHIDWPPESLGMVKMKTAIYYVNDNNGYTIFENGRKVSSKANRICIFDSELRHAGSTCTDQPCRVIINFNYIIPPQLDGKVANKTPDDNQSLVYS